MLRVESVSSLNTSRTRHRLMRRATAALLNWTCGTLNLVSFPSSVTATTRALRAGPDCAKPDAAPAIKQAKNTHFLSISSVHYSYRNDSIGSSAAALLAG